MEILFKDMWHHQIWGQFAVYAAGYAASSMLMPASVYIRTYVMPTLEVRPAYTVKEVSTASTMVILFSAYACLYCQRSLNCFYNAYSV